MLMDISGRVREKVIEFSELGSGVTEGLGFYGSGMDGRLEMLKYCYIF